MSTEARGRAWVEVEGGALRRNCARVRNVVGTAARLLPVVKADAYGLGFEGVVRELEPVDPWGYGIGTVEEGRLLRELGISRPALILAPILPEHVDAAIWLDLRPSVSSVEEVRRLAGAAESLGREVAFHVEVDTGMGRAGFPWTGAAEWGPEVAALARGRARWEGLYSHFHSAHRPASASVQEQADRFGTAARVLRAASGPAMSGQEWIEHLCNSAGLFRRPDLAGGLVRPGIFLYGGRPAPDLPEPDPVLALRARIVLVREVEPGDTLGYGALYKATRRERWATLGAGYSDGFPRALGKGAEALVGGRRVPIIGRISMGMIVVDTTDLPGSGASVGTPVTLVGADGDDVITLHEVEKAFGRSSYELLTGMSRRLPRIWT